MVKKSAEVLLFIVYVWLVCIPSFGQEEKATLPKEITNSMGMKFVLIPAGRFTMGSPASEKGSEENETLHKVEISKPYYLAAFEVTQGQYSTVMGKTGEIVLERDPKTNRVTRKLDIRSSPLPVTEVSWEDAVEFCKRLSLLPEEKKAGRSYRLPTEAQWEYACRAGTSTAYSFGDNANALGEYGWFDDNTNGPQPVGTKKANPWGLYDMHGNVYEWCSDWYGDYPEGLAVDPTGPADGSGRVRRGGSWGDLASLCRSAFRYWGGPSNRGDDLGFRLLLSPSEGPPEAR
jgi:formylglycine-generating enzyme required for sulfatase activity